MTEQDLATKCVRKAVSHLSVFSITLSWRPGQRRVRQSIFLHLMQWFHAQLTHSVLCITNKTLFWATVCWTLSCTTVTSMTKLSVIHLLSSTIQQSNEAFSSQHKTSQRRSCVKLKFHGSTFPVASSRHPRDILARMSRVSGVSARMSRGCYKDATRKLIPWNSSLSVQSGACEVLARRMHAWRETILKFIQAYMHIMWTNNKHFHPVLLTIFHHGIFHILFLFQQAEHL